MPLYYFPNTNLDAINFIQSPDPEQTELALDFFNNFRNITLNEIEILFSQIQFSNSILSLSILNLRSDAAYNIKKIASHSLITSLEIFCSDVKGDDLKALSENLKLIKLSLPYCKIGDTGAVILSKSKSIRTLKLHGNMIKDEGTIALANNSILENLSLSHNHIGVDGFLAIAKNETLTSFKAACNNEKKTFSRSINQSRSPEPDGYIDRQSIKALADNKSLKYLSLACNNLHKQEVLSFKDSAALESLDLELCGIGTIVAKQLIAKGSFQSLNLKQNRIGSPDDARLPQLEINQLLSFSPIDMERYWDTRQNEAKDTTIKSILCAIGTNISLKSLELSNVHIGNV